MRKGTRGVYGRCGDVPRADVEADGRSASIFLKSRVIGHFELKVFAIAPVDFECGLGALSGIQRPHQPILDLYGKIRISAPFYAIFCMAYSANVRESARRGHFRRLCAVSRRRETAPPVIDVGFPSSEDAKWVPSQCILENFTHSRRKRPRQPESGVPRGSERRRRWRCGECGTSRTACAAACVRALETAVSGRKSVESGISLAAHPGRFPRGSGSEILRERIPGSDG